MSHCVKTTSVFAVVVAHSCICPQQNFFSSPLSASPHSQNGQKVLPFNRAVGRSDNLREEIKYLSPIYGWVWGKGRASCLPGFDVNYVTKTRANLSIYSRKPRSIKIFVKLDFFTNVLVFWLYYSESIS